MPAVNYTEDRAQVTAKLVREEESLRKRGGKEKGPCTSWPFDFRFEMGGAKTGNHSFPVFCFKTKTKKLEIGLIFVFAVTNQNRKTENDPFSVFLF